MEPKYSIKKGSVNSKHGDGEIPNFWKIIHNLNP